MRYDLSHLPTGRLGNSLCGSAGSPVIRACSAVCGFAPHHCRVLPVILSLLLLASMLPGCSTCPHNGITQVATIDALLAGGYDGHMSLKTLRGYGDTGIGTFEGLDGEMLLLDGRFYQVRADGKVYQPADTVSTPFACVTVFVPDCIRPIKTPTDMMALEALVDELVPRKNSFCVFTLSGTFSRVRTRSVPAQKKPYPPLSEVTSRQPVFAIGPVSGKVVGFRSPSFVKGVNVPGYHLHFLADDLSCGGHILDFALIDGVLRADTVHEWMNIYLPKDNAFFDTADLSKDRSKELQSVEKERQEAATGPAGSVGVRAELTKPGDTSVVTTVSGAVVVSISSLTGIGGCRLVRTGNTWPSHLSLRLNLKDLESLGMNNGIVRLGTSLKRSGRVPYWKIGRTEGDGGQCDGDVDVPVTRVGGEVHVSIPPLMIMDNPPEISFGWIDYYR